MTSSPPLQRVGRALARLGSVRSAHAPGGRVAGDSRGAILEFIEAAPGVVRVEEIADAVRLHANTVRGHLDALLAAGRISRVPDQRSTPGRPHWLYSATASDSVRELARALEQALDRAEAPDGARLAAATWAEAGPEVAAATTPDEAVDAATEALSHHGFDAVRNPVGDEITLRACPYLELVDDHPVICDIHAELLAEVLKRTGQPVSVERLDVFPRPQMCVARLRRPDTEPVRVVELAEPEPAAARTSSPASRAPFPRKKR